MSLKGKVAVVTGASRGIGRGIALQLGAAGAKVYITGRNAKNKNLTTAQFDQVDPTIPTLEKTVQDITKRGGHGIAVYVDHSNNDQVKALFEKVDQENNGKLDILVNNAFSGLDNDDLLKFKKFWELEPQIWDTLNNVGLRSHYIASVYAARLFVKNGHSGLIVNISSVGAKKFYFTAAFGVGKAAVDRLTADTAIELKPHKVTVVSLWPAQVKTEIMQKAIEEEKLPAEIGKMIKFGFQTAESTEYSGKAVVALAKDPKVLEKTGKIFTTAGLGKEYGFKDIDGREIAELPEFIELLKL